MKNTEKQARLAHANALIKVIGSHGRRFFWHGGVERWNPETKTHHFEPADRYAYFELRLGRLYYVDDYTQKSIYLQPTGFTNKWRGFSHGGTLRGLVTDMRNYILTGTLIPRWKIVIQQLDKDLEQNIWGYSVEAALAVRAAAYVLPLMEKPLESA